MICADKSLPTAHAEMGEDESDTAGRHAISPYFALWPFSCSSSSARAGTPKNPCPTSSRAIIAGQERWSDW